MSMGAGVEPEMDDGYKAVSSVKVFSNRELRVEVIGCDDDVPGSGASRMHRLEDDKGACNSQHPSLVGASVRTVDYFSLLFSVPFLEGVSCYNLHPKLLTSVSREI